MKKRLLHRPSPALVVALIALFVALGGTSYAAFKIPRNSVGTAQLKAGSVSNGKIRNGAVSAAKINPTGLTVPKAVDAKHADSATSASTAEHATSADKASDASHATTARSATTADHAATADSATNASAVGGLTPSELQMRVGGACGTYGALQTIDSQGSVTCGQLGTQVWWAVVNSDASLSREWGAASATSASKLGTGKYAVDFFSDVSSCAYTATIGIGTSPGQPPSGEISVAPLVDDVHGVYVVTHDDTGTLTNLPFHLLVACY